MEFQKTIVFFGEQEVLIYIGSVIVVCEKKIDIFFKLLYNFASTETQARFKKVREWYHVKLIARADRQVCLDMR